MNLEKEYHTIRENSVADRYVNHLHLEDFLKTKEENLSVVICGSSVENRSIYEITMGKGPLKILIWSQMHGNETTTTKAVLDLINFLETSNEVSDRIKLLCTIKIVPMLNPDGAWAYTRHNANGVDLNRDAQKRTQPETRILYTTYSNFQPAFCFNLHGQRTIYSAGKAAIPATLSFLAPAADTDRSLTPSRLKTMKLIAAICEKLEPHLGPRIGRYDDGFNLNCIGDTLMAEETPTILFEAGHHPGDYTREETRKYIWLAMVHGLDLLAQDSYSMTPIENYQAIPNNQKLFFDILVKNAHVLSDSYGHGQSIGVLYNEVLEDSQIKFSPEISDIGKLDGHFGHVEYDCNNPEDIESIQKDESLHSLIF